MEFDGQDTDDYGFIGQKTKEMAEQIFGGFSDYKKWKIFKSIQDHGGITFDLQLLDTDKQDNNYCVRKTYTPSQPGQGFDDFINETARSFGEHSVTQIRDTEDEGNINIKWIKVSIEFNSSDFPSSPNNNFIKSMHDQLSLEQEYIEKRLQEISPTLHFSDRFDGLQISENFNPDKLGLGRNDALETASPRPSDLANFKKELLEKIGEPEESLSNDDRFSKVYSSAPWWIDAHPETVEIPGSFSYRSDGGKIYIYSPTPRPGSSKILEITETTGKILKPEPGSENGTREYKNINGKNNTIFDHVKPIRGHDHVIIIPAKVSATAADIAKNNEKVIFTKKNETLKKILELDLDLGNSPDSQSGSPQEKIIERLGEIRFFDEIEIPGLGVNESDDLEILDALSEFEIGREPTVVLRGRAPELTISNPNVFYLPMVGKGKFSGLLVDLAKKEYAPIPKSLEERVRLYSTDHFRAIFSQNYRIKNHDNIKSNFHKYKMADGFGRYLNETKNMPDEMKISHYLDAVVCGLINPTDDDFNYIGRFDSLFASNYGMYSDGASHEKEIYGASYFEKSTMSELKSRTNNPIIEDWRSKLKEDAEYVENLDGPGDADAFIPGVNPDTGHDYSLHELEHLQEVENELARDRKEEKLRVEGFYS